MRIEVAAGELSTQEYGQLVPGVRVEYRGAFWKVVGMYFARRAAASAAGQPTKYLVLQSLDLKLDSLRPLGATRLA